jgi:hypothetical protein
MPSLNIISVLSAKDLKPFISIAFKNIYETLLIC